MNRQRIAYVNFHFFDTDVTVIKELQKTFDVEWFVILRDRDEAYHQDFFEEFVKNTDIQLHIYKYTCRRRDLKFLKLLFKVMNDIRNKNVSLLYTSCGNLYLQLALYRYIHTVPIVYGIHDVRLHSSAKVLLPERLAESLLYKFGKYFFTFSKNQYDLFQRLHKKKMCYMVGMSIKNFGISKLCIPDKKLGTRLLMFGSMYKYKGYDLLIDAYECLLNEYVGLNTKLSMYGSATGDDLVFIEKKTAHQSNYDLHLDFVDNDILKDIYSTNHFVVMPYRDATQSGPLMIAVFYGIPIIAPNFGIFKEILSPNNAILYDQQSQDGLYNALKKAIAMPNDEYNEMRHHCALLKQKYSEESIGKRYVQAFLNVILSTSK
jgi:glycosyltransferase involved in cell wall biosynthesis